MSRPLRVWTSVDLSRQHPSVHWIARAVVAYGLMAVPGILLYVLTQLLLRWPSDQELVGAIISFAGLPGFFLCYRYLPPTIGQPPSIKPAELRSGWFSGWGWKWICLMLWASTLFIQEVGGAVFRAGLWPADDRGFASRMTPKAQQLWIKLHFSGYLNMAALLFIPTLYLFWRDWRQPKPRSGYCLICGYSLTGNTSGVCPECGTAVGSAQTIPSESGLLGPEHVGKG